MRKVPSDVMKTSHAPNVSSHGGDRDCGGCEGGRFVVSLTRLQAVVHVATDHRDSALSGSILHTWRPRRPQEAAESITHPVPTVPTKHFSTACWTSRYPTSTPPSHSLAQPMPAPRKRSAA